jgi:hypothetical protein
MLLLLLLLLPPDHSHHHGSCCTRCNQGHSDVGHSASNAECCAVHIHQNIFLALLLRRRRRPHHSHHHCSCCAHGSISNLRMLAACSGSLLAISLASGVLSANSLQRKEAAVVRMGT